MSINNQVLIKEFRGKWYVFDVMAESWVDEKDRKNHLSTREALKSFDNKDEAYDYAFEYATTPNEIGLTPEYGVLTNYLAKDGAEVTIYE